MAILILGAPVRFRPAYARAHGVDAEQVFTIRSLYRRPGHPAIWVILDGLPAPTNRVPISELR
jgi:hypothetical protein